MTELMQKALDAMRGLPPERQDVIALTVLSIIEDDQEPVHVPDEHKAAIDEARAELARGEHVTYEDMKAVFAKYR